MNPRDSHTQADQYALREPDLILTFDLNSFNRNKGVIEELRKGDYIRFNATITHMGIRREVTTEGQKDQLHETKYQATDEE